VFVNPGRFVWLASALALAPPSLDALDRDKLISQFTHTSWSAKDGIPGPVRAIAQTPDGYLWLGTEAGLYLRANRVQYRCRSRSGTPPKGS